MHGAKTKRGDAMRLLNNVRRCRFDDGEMSQQELADRVGVTRMTIYSIEKGKYVPSAALALKIARVFGKPVEEIFSLPDEEGDEA
jgi:putative transcriptional regulator